MPSYAGEAPGLVGVFQINLHSASEATVFLPQFGHSTGLRTQKYSGRKIMSTNPTAIPHGGFIPRLFASRETRAETATSMAKGAS